MAALIVLNSMRRSRQAVLRGGGSPWHGTAWLRVLHNQHSIVPTLVQCWASVCDAGPTLSQRLMLAVHRIPGNKRQLRTGREIRPVRSKLNQRCWFGGRRWDPAPDPALSYPELTCGDTSPGAIPPYRSGAERHPSLPLWTPGGIPPCRFGPRAPPCNTV